MTVELDEGVLRLTFQRPEVLNALTGLMAVTVAEQLERATADDDVRVVVITGSGGSFSAGADISGADAHERFDVARARRRQPDHPGRGRLLQARRSRRSTGSRPAWAARSRSPPT